MINTGGFKILYIVPYAPTRIRSRPYYLIRALARAGHKVVLATVWENEAERSALDELRAEQIEVITFALTKPRIFTNLLRSLISTYPLQAGYSWQPELMKAISDALRVKPFDIIQVEHLRGAKYALRLGSEIEKNHIRVPVVWDAVDCISMLFEQAVKHNPRRIGRWIAKFELPRTRNAGKGTTQ